MTDERHNHQHESDVLLRQLDGHLARLRARETKPQFGVVPRLGGEASAGDGVAPDESELALAERIAEPLRQIIADTVRSSAVDRARVRAAVHYFVVRRAHLGVWVVNDILRDLGRQDLLIPEPALA